MKLSCVYVNSRFGATGNVGNVGDISSSKVLAFTPCALLGSHVDGDLHLAWRYTSGLWGRKKNWATWDPTYVQIHILLLYFKVIWQRKCCKHHLLNHLHWIFHTWMQWRELTTLATKWKIVSWKWTFPAISRALVFQEAKDGNGHGWESQTFFDSSFRGLPEVLQTFWYRVSLKPQDLELPNQETNHFWVDISWIEAPSLRKVPRAIFAFLVHGWQYRFLRGIYRRPPDQDIV